MTFLLELQEGTKHTFDLLHSAELPRFFLIWLSAETLKGNSKAWHTFMRIIFIIHWIRKRRNILLLLKVLHSGLEPPTKYKKLNNKPVKNLNSALLGVLNSIVWLQNVKWLKILFRWKCARLKLEKLFLLRDRARSEMSHLFNILVINNSIRQSQKWTKERKK